MSAALASALLPGAGRSRPDGFPRLVTSGGDQAPASVSAAKGRVAAAIPAMEAQRWTELRTRLESVLASLDATRSAPAEGSAAWHASQIIPGWYTDAPALRAKLEADVGLPQLLADIALRAEAEREAFNLMAHMRDPSPEEAKALEEVRTANESAQRSASELRQRVESLLFVASPEQSDAFRRFDRHPPTVDEIFAYLLDTHRLLLSAATKQEQGLMDSFFRREEFEHGVASIAHAIGISVAEAHAFVTHAHPGQDSTRRYSHPDTPPDKQGRP